MATITPNALNREQQKALDRLTRRKRRQFEDAARATLATPHARYFLGEWLDQYAGLNRSTFHQSGSVMAYQEGARDAGLKLLEALEAADDKATEQMLAEVRDRKRRDAREMAALHTTRAEDGPQEERDGQDSR